MDGQSKSKPVIGLVGGIGAGKSTAAGEFVRLGCALVDGDAIGHALLAEPDVRRQVRAEWGEGVFAPDGSVDRRALGQRVFQDAAALAALNRILHPRIRAGMAEEIRRAQADPAVPAVVVDAAVLFEAGWEDLCTHVVFVAASPEDRSRRACAAKGWDSGTWRGRENSQISLDNKARNCDYTIENSSCISCLRERVRQLFHKMVRVADRP